MSGCARLARDAARRGLRVDVYPEPDKLGKQFKYAARAACPSSPSSATTSARGRGGGEGSATGAQQRSAARPRGCSRASAKAGRPDAVPWLNNSAPRAHPHLRRAARRATSAREVVLLGWVHRVRDLGSLIFIDLRDRDGITQVVVDDDEASCSSSRQAAALRSSSWPSSGRAAALARHHQPEASRRARSRSSRASARAERGEDAAVPIADETPRCPRRCGSSTGTSTCGARACSRQHRAAPSRHDGPPPLLRRAGVLGGRDAHPHQVHAGGRPRLPRAEPRAPGRVLRAAAVAADLQADPDDRGWTATSRSRAASATRTCARTGSPSSRRSTSRWRSPRPVWSSRSSRPALAAAFREIGVEVPRPSGGWPTRRPSRYGTDKPDLRFGLEIQDVGALFAETRRSASSARPSSTAGPCAGSSFPARRRSRGARSTSSSSRRQALGAAGLVWAAAIPRTACRRRR
jgi:hypothetical protein